MIVCHCERVSERAIAKAIASGSSTVGAISQATRAGRGCGCCVTSLKRLIEQHFAAPTTKEIPREAA